MVTSQTNEGDYNEPKTIKEAVERFFEVFEQEDFDLIVEMPKKRLNFLYANLERGIVDIFDLDAGNEELLEDCGSRDMKSEEAAHIIIKAIWEDIH